VVTDLPIIPPSKTIREFISTFDPYHEFFTPETRLILKLANTTDNQAGLIRPGPVAAASEHVHASSSRQEGTPCHTGRKGRVAVGDLPL
jgi:hypothetical protein